MQQKLDQNNYQTLICSAEDFLVKHSQSLEKGEVSRIQEDPCFLRLQEYLNAKDLKLYSLKTSKAYSITKKGKLLKKLLKNYGNWGITVNGWFLTARILKHPKTGRECSLLDIIEKKPDQKYYLSEKTLKGLIKRIRKGWNLDMMEIIKAKESIQIKELHQQYPSAKQEEIIFRLLSKKIRRLTPLECERLQGFPDNWTKGVSMTERYSQMGRAVNPKIIKEIVKTWK